MNKRLWGYVTTTGRVVASGVLEQYAVKQESKQLLTEQTFADVKGLLAPLYDPYQLASLLELNTAHLAACRQKAEDVIGAGWEWQETREDPDQEARAELEALFTNPPHTETAFGSVSVRDALVAAQMDYESMGRGVLELVRERPDGPVVGIYHVPAYTVRVAADGKRFAQRKGGKTVWFKWAGSTIDVHKETGEIADLGALDLAVRANEIVWWRQYHPRDPVYGLPDVIPAIGAIHGDVARRDYNIDFFANYGIPAYAVFISGDFDPGGMVDAEGKPVPDGDPNAVMTETEWHVHQLLDQVRQNPHSSLVLAVPTREADPGQQSEVKIEFQPLSTEVKEASFRMYRRDNREEVLSSHRMSSAIAGVFDQGTANREARAQYRQAVIAPRRAMLEMIVNTYIVSTFGDTGWRWALAPADARDTDVVLDRAERGVRVGAITPREARRRIAPLLGIPAEVPEALDDQALDRFYPLGRAQDGGQDADRDAREVVKDELEADRRERRAEREAERKERDAVFAALKAVEERVAAVAADLEAERRERRAEREMATKERDATLAALQAVEERVVAVAADLEAERRERRAEREAAAKERAMAHALVDDVSRELRELAAAIREVAVDS